MFRRAIIEHLRPLIATMPIVTMTGPRQSGKTTLAKLLCPGKPYVSLETPDVRLEAREDPRGFLGRYPDGAILDEVQREPELLSYIQGIVDEKQKPGMFVLTGSANFGLMKSVSQSLAGRTVVAELLPMSIAELAHEGFAEQDVGEFIYRGGYPRIYDRGVEPAPLLSSYVATYLERDVRELINVKDLHQFDLFLRLCAGRSGQILNATSLGNDCGVSHVTVRSWLSVLEASYVIHFVPPHYRNFGKRLVKSPKMYFTDVGLMANLLGIQNAQQVSVNPLRGALFETLVVSELLKARLNALQRPNLYFFADSTGGEIDVVLDDGAELVPVEIKSAQTFSDSLTRSLQFYLKLNPAAARPTLVYSGENRQFKGIAVVNFRQTQQIATAGPAKPAT